MCTPLTRRLAFILALVAAFPALAQNKPGNRNENPPAGKDPPQVDQAKVDAAIAKGSEWLRAILKKGLPPTHWAKGGHHDGSTLNEIVLYTLIHAGVNRGDPDLIKLVNEVRGKPPVHTYTGAMRAMALALYDPVKMRADIGQTAQFLVDNQGKNGLWGYSEPVALPRLPPVVFSPSKEPPKYTLSEGGGPGASPAGAASGGTSRPGTTTAKKAPPPTVIQRRGWGDPNDNSNAQYAILGLWACISAGINPSFDCLPLAERWFTECQNEDGGWSYNDKGNRKSYGSMTVAGVSSLAVCLRGSSSKPLDPTSDPRIRRGLEWLGKHLSFDANPGKVKGWHYYWIYGVERAGSLAETEWFGDKPWYHEGATWLLDHQNKDGMWGEEEGVDDQILDTCWAILFLRRATKHIMEKKIYTQ